MQNIPLWLCAAHFDGRRRLNKRFRSTARPRRPRNYQTGQVDSIFGGNFGPVTAAQLRNLPAIALLAPNRLIRLPAKNFGVGTGSRFHISISLLDGPEKQTNKLQSKWIRSKMAIGLKLLSGE